jgi:hypothetical protein
MGWTVKDLYECTRYGKLYRVKKIRSDGALCIRRLRREHDLFREVEKPMWVNLDGLPVTPEIGDLIFRSSDKAPSLLKGNTELIASLLAKP